MGRKRASMYTHAQNQDACFKFTCYWRRGGVCVPLARRPIPMIPGTSCRMLAFWFVIRRDHQFFSILLVRIGMSALWHHLSGCTWHMGVSSANQITPHRHVFLLPFLRVRNTRKRLTSPRIRPGGELSLSSVPPTPPAP